MKRLKYFILVVQKIMTQKEKLMRATMMAHQIKSVADSLRYDAKDYDVRFPISHADRLESIANEFLKLK